VDAIRGKDQKIVLLLNLHRHALRVTNDQVLNLNVAEGSTHAQLTIYSVLKDEAVCCFDALALFRAVRHML
jgi:hypothetical protein